MKCQKFKTFVLFLIVVLGIRYIISACLYLFAEEIHTNQQYEVKVSSDSFSTEIKLSNRIKSPPRVYIYEEHQEALLTWYSSLGNESFSSTLIYADAHPGMIPPDPKLLLHSLYTRPSPDQLEGIIQGSDSIIISSIMSNLFTNIIWIFPSWVKVEYSDQTIFPGTGSINNNPTYCHCNIKKKMSYFTNTAECETWDAQNQKFISTSQSECLTSEVKIRLLKIRDADVIENLDKITPLLSEVLVLDIDEDFFGVEFVHKHLENAGVSISHIDNISHEFEKMLCPAVFQHESQADNYFHELCMKLPDWRNEYCALENGVYSCFDHLDQEADFAQVIRYNENIDEIMCNIYNKTKARIQLAKGVELLMSLTKDQLKLLAKVGLCFSESTRTYDRQPVIKLCIGRSHVDKLHDNEHVPSRIEIIKHLKLLRSILRKFPVPDVVTLTRSSREGRSMRQLQSSLEFQLIKILKQVFQINSNEIVYDSMLAGGIKGWLKRR